MADGTLLGVVVVVTRPRWMAPLNAVDVEDHPERLVVMADGEVRRDVNIVFEEDTFRRLKMGYLCAECYEPHDSPFPERCKLCGFPMRREQPAKVDSEFEGYTWIGPSRATIEGLDNATDETVEKMARRSGIFLPKGVGAS